MRPEDTEIEENVIINLIAKTMFERGTVTPTILSDEIKLAKSVINIVLEEMVRLQLVESRGLASTDIRSDIRYHLTTKGSAAALEAMALSQYIGPAPVTLETFTKQVRRQSIAHETVLREDLETSMRHLVFPDEIHARLGPAANSGKSILLYGEPGNGKTSIAEALGTAFKDTIFVPYSIIVGNQIIKFFDETVHTPVESTVQAETRDAALDLRWIECERPVVITGGELTLEMLDLMYSTTSRFYEAPIHLKALGGIFIVDDFGRQQTTPREILNRWIVPLEKGHDFLHLHTGKKFTVPFDQLVIFSTNMMPEELSDGAALRRLYFKILVPTPTKENYLKIFQGATADADLEYAPDVVSAFFDKVYTADRKIPSGAHPKFLLDHIKAACIYSETEPSITGELLELAWKNVTADSDSSSRG
jgi:predicted ATPase with chaperone activity